MIEVKSALSKISSLFATSVRILLVPLLISLFYTLFAGSLVTFDGNQYLATAHSIGKLSLTQGYLFGRPPLYPAFLALMLEISKSDRFLIFIQVLVIALTLQNLIRAINKELKKNFNFTIPNWLIVAICISPTIAGYGTTVLQQPLFIVETNLCLLLLLRIYVQPRRIPNILLIGLMVLLSIWTGEGILPFTVTAITIAILFILADGGYKINSAKLSALFLAILVPIGLLSLSVFQHWGESQPGSTTYSVPQGNLIAKYPSFFINDPLNAFNDLFDAYVTQSGLAPAIQAKGLLNSPSTAMFENRIHAEATFNSSRRCGVSDTNSSGSWYKFSLKELQQNCSPLSLPSNIYNLASIWGLLLSFISFMFLPLALILGVFFCKRLNFAKGKFLLIIALPALILRLAYITIGFQPDRYVVQLFPEFITVFFISIKLMFDGCTNQNTGSVE